MLKLYCHTAPEALTVPERNNHFHQINRLISLDGHTIARADTGKCELIPEKERKRERERDGHEEEKEREKHKGEQALTAAIHSCIAICQS